MSYGRRPRRKTWAQLHDEWLATPVGSLENARREMLAKHALGKPADDEVRYWGGEALRIGREHGYDVSGIERSMAQFEERVAARGY